MGHAAGCWGVEFVEMFEGCAISGDFFTSEYVLLLPLWGAGLVSLGGCYLIWDKGVSRKEVCAMGVIYKIVYSIGMRVERDAVVLRRYL